MAKEWTDEEIRTMVNDSVRILAEDNEKNTYRTLHEKYGQKPEGNKPEGDKPEDEKTPPPAKEKEKEKEEDKPQRKPLWGNYADDTE